MSVGFDKKSFFFPVRPMYSGALVKETGSSLSLISRFYLNQRELGFGGQKRLDVIKKISSVHPVFSGEFLKRISKKQQEDITRVMAESPSLEDWEVRSLQERNFGDQNSIFQRKGDWLYRGLKAYSEKKIDENVLAHIFLYDSCKDCPGFMVHSGDEANSLLSKIWYQRFAPTTKVDSNEVGKTEKFDPLSSLSEQDCQIFSFHVELKSPTIFHLITAGVEMGSRRLYPFVNKKNSNSLEIIMIPPNVFQRFLNLRFGFQAIQCSPVVGYRSIEKLSDPTKRVVSICGRFVAPCDQVHCYDGTKYPASMLFHDYYHCLVESSNPHRMIYAQIAMLPGITERLKMLFLDRELVDYLRLSNGDTLPLIKKVDECFWNYIFTSIGGEDSQKVLPYILRHLKSWEKEYSISIANFEENREWYWSEEESTDCSEDGVRVI